MTDTDEADEMYLEFNSKDEVLQFVIELGWQQTRRGYYKG